MKRLHEFGPFRVDPDRSLLLRGTEPVALTAKAFETLMVLIQHRQETVSKDELLKTVWPDTFVEEANLTQHVSMLRKALGETPQDRRYIVTVPGRGYRFVARVREVPSREGYGDAVMEENHKGDGMTVKEEEADHAGSEAASTPKAKTVTWILICALLVVLAAIGATSRLKHWGNRSALSAKDTVLLADFDNFTGEPIFDGALKQGLAAQLGQSPFLDIVANDQVRETLRFMGHSPDERVQLPLAREICERAGSKALIAGSIGRFGRSYVVALEGLNCADATTLAREQVEADNKEQVLSALSGAASKLRQKLGESLSSVQRFDIPIEQATTPSLEALRAYSLAMEQRTLGMEKNSIPLFEHAIELDPKFAMAHAELGTVYTNLGETEHGGEYLKKAYALRGNLSEREKFYLTVRYYTVVTGQTDKATGTLEMWARIYPRDWIPFNGLSARYQVVGQYEKAANAAAEALRLQPNHYLPFANLALSYMRLNRFEDAAQVCQRSSAAHRDSIYTHRVLFQIAFLHHDQAGMQREIDWATGTDRENDMLAIEGLAQVTSGKLRAGRQLFQRSWATSQRNNLKDDAAFSMAGEALAEADFGNYERAHSQAVTAASLGHGIDAQETAAEALALSGDVSRAQAIAQDLQDRFPQHMPLNVVSLPTIFASIELQRGHPEKTIRLLQDAVPYDLCEFASLGPIYIRGQAYLRLHAGKEAAAEFRKILDHSGVDVPSPRRTLAYLGLARALKLQGDTAGARQAFQDFLSQWSDADADIPILRQAKIEYARQQ